MSKSSNNLAAYSWSIADLLRGDFKQSQYGRIILPFTLLRRLECVLAPTKPAVLAEAEKLAKQKLPEEALEKLLLRATGGLSFFNTSRMDLSTLGESGIKDNLLSYVAAFSKDAREIFEYFNFAEFVGQLNDANLLYKVVQRVRQSDLSPAVVSNHEMGLVFEELIRRFAESSNETAGEHFTPRDIVHLTTSLVFMEDDDALTKPGIIRTIYDPTAGTGGFLSAGMEYVHAQNPEAVIRAFGQELNPESYAICKGDMLIKGQDVSRIKLGNTLSNDQLYADKFDYMLSNPPFGVDWKKIEGDILKEHLEKGFDGRFGPGLPRVSDGSLLFLLHLLSKLRDPRDGGGRIGIILNGSPLFTGGAGSGESEIRRHILENDLLEAIVALPTDMFYNTGIATYVWILSNKKPADRKGRVMLVDYDDTDLEKLSLYARNLAPLLREQIVDDDEVDLSHVVLSHYRLSKIRQQDFALEEDQSPYGLKPGEGLGSARARDKREEFLSQIIARLNELFVTDHLTEQDLVNYAYTVRDKVRENEKVMKQIANNSEEQAMLGDFPRAVDDAILDSGAAHENQKLQLLSDPRKASAFAKLIFDLLKLAS